MSLMDSLFNAAGSLLGNQEGGSAQGMALAESLLQQSGGLSGLVQQLSSSGLGDVVQSWVGTGANLPVSPEQISQALGPDILSSLASKVGLSGDSLNGALAQMLPSVVDKLTPGGQLPTDNGFDLSSLASQLFGKQD